MEKKLSDKKSNSSDEAKSNSNYESPVIRTECIGTGRLMNVVVCDGTTTSGGRKNAPMGDNGCTSASQT